MATDKLFATVRQTPVRLLRNEIVDLDGVSIVGLDDPLFGYARLDLTTHHPVSRSAVVLMHEPDYVDELLGAQSIVLSGHSHGGEVCLPGGIPIHTPRGARKYKSGFYPSARTPLYVSRGVATLSPFRVFCPPEVTLLTLNSQ